MSVFGKRGSRLMAALVVRDPSLVEEGNPLREIAVSACLAADRLARLEELAAEVEPWQTNEKGVLITHPVLVEVRQQATLLSRLIAALRLPDERSGKRPQSRPLRGVHAPGGAKLTSIERARQRAQATGEPA
jgi:hypothetical protein